MTMSPDGWDSRAPSAREPVAWGASVVVSSLVAECSGGKGLVAKDDDNKTLHQSRKCGILTCVILIFAQVNGAASHHCTSVPPESGHPLDGVSLVPQTDRGGTCAPTLMTTPSCSTGV